MPLTVPLSNSWLVVVSSNAVPAVSAIWSLAVAVRRANNGFTRASLASLASASALALLSASTRPLGLEKRTPVILQAALNRFILALKVLIVSLSARAKLSAASFADGMSAPA